MEVQQQWAEPGSIQTSQTLQHHPVQPNLIEKNCADVRWIAFDLMSRFRLDLRTYGCHAHIFEDPYNVCYRVISIKLGLICLPPKYNMISSLKEILIKTRCFAHKNGSMKYVCKYTLSLVKKTIYHILLTYF